MPRVVGRESGLESGYTDLVLLDRRGQVCLVEVKREGNPDTRRVVAQLLDYATSLWGCSLPDFERVVLHPSVLCMQPYFPSATLTFVPAERFAPADGFSDRT